MPKKQQDVSPEYGEYKQNLAREIGSRIRKRRTVLGLTQESLRAKVGVEGVSITRAQLSRLENGETIPDAAEIIAISKALDVPVSYLLPDK